jgi:hypothetical protein
LAAPEDNHAMTRFKLSFIWEFLCHHSTRMKSSSIPTGLLSLKMLLPFSLDQDIDYNADQQEALKRTIKKAREVGLINAEDDIRKLGIETSTELAAVWFPTADVDVLTLVSDYFLFLFAFDDHIVDVAENSMESLIETQQKIVDELCVVDSLVYSERECDDCYVEHLRQIYKDMDLYCKSLFPEDYKTTSNDVGEMELHPIVKRFHHLNQDYVVQGTMESSKFITEQRDLSLEEYVVLRSYDSAVYPTVFLQELALGIWVKSEKTLQDERYKKLNQEAVNIVALWNDIASFDRERKTRLPINAISVCMAHGDSFEAAAMKVTNLVSYAFKTLDEIAEFPASSWEEGDDIVHLVNLHRRTMIAACVWHLKTDRYKTNTNPFIELLKF